MTSYGKNIACASALGILVSLVVASSPARAHEVRPAYLEITAHPQTDADKRAGTWRYDIIWRRPVQEGQSLAAMLPLRPRFPAACTEPTPRRRLHRPGILGEEFALVCSEPLLGQWVGVEGLAQSITDALVLLRRADGRLAQYRLTPQRPAAQLGGQRFGFGAYFRLGVVHLLGGWDHLLFVLGLLLLIAGWRRLVGVITAFTLAHSLTLFLAVLGVIALPVAAVEAAIALSVLYVAYEAGLPREQRDIFAERHPYVLAFAFGLLHGGGFASVLGTLGLPDEAKVWALAMFNLGLEAGQLSLIAAYFILSYALQAALARGWLGQAAGRVLPRLWPHAALLPMGGIAAFWVISRSAAMLRPLW